MTEASQAPPKIIVVGEDEIHALLRDCGAPWDVQHPVASIGQMWDDLSGDRLDPSSVAVIFTDTVHAGPGELETAIAAMAPAAATFLVVFHPDSLTGLLGRVREAATLQDADPDAPVHVLSTESGHELLDAVRDVLTSADVAVDFPHAWAVEPGALSVGGSALGDRGPDHTIEHGADASTRATTVAAVRDVPVPPAGRDRRPAALEPLEPVAAMRPAAPMRSMALMDPPEPLAGLTAVNHLTASAPVTVPPVEALEAVETLAAEAPVTRVTAAASVIPIDLAPAATRKTQLAPGGAEGIAARGAGPTRSMRPDSAPAEPHAAQIDPSTRAMISGQVTIAVTSAKGGSGKSTTAMMLAAQIAQSSKRAHELGKADRPLKVVLIDMDTRDGQVASLMGRYVPTSLNIRVQPRWDEATILDNLVHDTRLGIDCLLAPVRPRTADDVGPEFYRHVIRMLKTTHDVVILDTSVNYLDPLISTVCLPEATAILFVTTLATTSVQGMARALREITEPLEEGGMGINRRRIGIVVNQSITEVGMDRDQVLQAALRVSIVGAIPLATKDVLTCTNFNRMHQLLDHPLLGPAYFKLARTCMPNAVLEPVYDADPTDERSTLVPPSPAASASSPLLVGAGSGGSSHASAPAARRRGLFGRRG